MLLFNRLLLFTLTLCLFGCATGSNKTYKPLPPREKLTSYPDPKDSERIAKIHYDILFKKPITKEDEEFYREKAVKTITGQYEMAHMFFLGKKYKLAKSLLQLPADRGFGLAQYECGIANAESNGKAEETYAYFYLAAKSNLKEAYLPAREVLRELDTILSEKQKARGKELAENIQSAYLPEFATEVAMTEFLYFGVLMQSRLDFIQNDIASKDTKSYAKEKRNLD